jgi:hypothetical protein
MSGRGIWQFLQSALSSSYFVQSAFVSAKNVRTDFLDERPSSQKGNEVAFVSPCFESKVL